MGEREHLLVDERNHRAVGRERQRHCAPRSFEAEHLTLERADDLERPISTIEGAVDHLAGVQALFAKRLVSLEERDVRTAIGVQRQRGEATGVAALVDALNGRASVVVAGVHQVALGHVEVDGVQRSLCVHREVRPLLVGLGAGADGLDGPRAIVQRSVFDTVETAELRRVDAQLVQAAVGAEGDRVVPTIVA